MKPDTTLKHLRNEVEATERHLDGLREQARRLALADLQAKVIEFDIQPSDLVWPPRPKPKREKDAPDLRAFVPVKYRNPATGDTWTGRGTMPRWLVDLTKAGSSLDAFRVRYRDPQTGDEWDSSGSMPRWLLNRAKEGHAIVNYRVDRFVADEASTTPEPPADGQDGEVSERPSM